MAELILNEEEKEGRSYLDWDEESLGKYVKKRAIELEDYYGEHVSERGAALITLISRVHQMDTDMTMMEVEGLTIEGENLGKWRVTFEKVDPDLPGGPPTDDGDDLPGDDDDREGGVLIP